MEWTQLINTIVNTFPITVLEKNVHQSQKARFIPKKFEAVEI
jgi:hypothetical protein